MLFNCVPVKSGVVQISPITSTFILPAKVKSVSTDKKGTEPQSKLPVVVYNPSSGTENPVVSNV